MRASFWCLFLVLCSAAVAAERAAAEGIAPNADPMCGEHAGEPADLSQPVAAAKPSPVYPPGALRDWSEGWAVFDATITTDGSTKDIVLLDRVGAEGFVTASLAALKNWKYQPARRGGVAVEVYGAKIIVTFIFEDTGAGEREATNSEFHRRYELARAKLQERNAAEAVQIMRDALSFRISLYEQAMGSYLVALALASADPRNWHDALIHIRHALIDDGAYLQASVKPSAVDLAIRFEAQDGNYKQALCLYGEERAKGTVLSPQTAQLAEKIAAVLNAPAPLVIPAEIFADTRPNMTPRWTHSMLRHKFAFAAVKGNAKSFRLQCTATVLESPVNEETQWTVPGNAGSCRLIVYGDPGTTFQLIEE